MSKIKIIKFFILTATLILIFGCKSIEFQSALIYINQQDDWKKGIELLEKALKKDPTDPEIHILLGQGYAMQEDYKKMDEAFNSAMSFMTDSNKTNKILKEDIEYLRDDFWCYSFNKGVENFENNRIADAGIDFSNCIIIGDKRAEAYINLALVEEKINSVESAIEHYEKAFQLDHKNIELMFYVADLQNNSKNYQKAIEAMDKVLSVEPGLVEAITQKAIAYDYLGETEKAIAAYQKALLNLPDDTDLLFNLGRLYFFEGDYFEAIKNFQKVITQKPDDAETIAFIGDSYFSLGEDIMIEIQEFNENDSIEISQQEIEAYKNQAKEYFNEAISNLEQAIELEIDNPDVWNILAIAYSNVGLDKKAKAIFKNEESLKR